MNQKPYRHILTIRPGHPMEVEVVYPADVSDDERKHREMLGDKMTPVYAVAQPQTARGEPQGVVTAEFEAWWTEHGQFCRAGGGDYEKTFAFRAWEAARSIDRQDWNRVHHALAKHGMHPGRTDDHLADVIARALAVGARLAG